MSEKKTNKKDLTKLSYDELEEESANVIEALNNESLGLDEASKIYEYGVSIYKEMEKRLSELEQNVTNTVHRGE